jgi:hypothetical protein
MPDPKRTDHSDQNRRIIGEIQNYVATMLRAQSVMPCHRDISILQSLKMLRAASYGSRKSTTAKAKIPIRINTTDTATTGV